MTFRMPRDVPGLLADIDTVRQQSGAARDNALPANDNIKRIAAGAWLRADGFARTAHSLATEPVPNLDVLGQIARALWEGMVTLEYVRRSPEIRSEQMLVAALRKTRQIAASAWGRERGARDLGPEPAAFVAHAERREKEYRKARKSRQNAGEDIEPFDYDQCAEPPSIEVMARGIGAHDQYEVVYRMESSRATHWGLHALVPHDEPPQRLLQAVLTIAACYRGLLFHCAEVLGVDPSPFRIGQQ